MFGVGTVLMSLMFPAGDMERGHAHQLAWLPERARDGLCWWWSCYKASLEMHVLSLHGCLDQRGSLGRGACLMFPPPIRTNKPEKTFGRK